MQLLQFFLRQVLDGGNLIFGPLDRNDQLGKLELDRERIAVLGVLNEKHHEKCHDRRRGVDDELPGIAVAEQGPGNRPGRDYEDGDCKGERLAGKMRRRGGQP